MFMMVFVNDLPTSKEVPEWLKHTAAEYDGMGFSDIIFPLFLFIVGLSIPLAINRRRQRGQSTGQQLWHVFERSAALIVMGVFMVNISHVNPALMPFGKDSWQLLMGVGIMLFWMHYRPISYLGSRSKVLFKTLGAALLIYLALIYAGGDTDAPIGMQPRWWGILGLIGWAYLLNALFYMIIGARWQLIALGCLILLFFNMQEFGMIDGFPQIRIVVSGSMHLLVMLGVLSTTLMLRLREQSKPNTFTLVAIGIGAILIAAGFLIRPYWIISKILATPTWTLICAGSGFILMGFLYWLADLKGHASWARIIMPAGTSTLTCYLLPYIIYPLIVFSQLNYPDVINTGFMGILRALVFAFVVVLLTGALERKKLKLKV
jgi:predicted acyltransferase